MPRLILASASPRRIRLLQSAGFEAQVVPASIAELDCAYLTPAELTLFNAYQKASSVAQRHRDRTVLGADTVVALDSQIFGKPNDLDTARRMLKALVGKTHEVVTGIVVIDGPSGQFVVEAVRTTVAFRELSESQIEDYLKVVEPLDKAGAYAAQESPELIIRKTEGSFTNVIGLPMEVVTSILADFGMYPHCSN